MSVPNTLKVPLINLFLAGLLGGLLRYFPVHPFNWMNYKFIVHTHSHVAFLGWVYLSLFILIIQVYFSNDLLLQKKYSIQFWLTQLSVVGMFFTFPFQGYGLYSIFFSTMHILLSYWFAYSFITDIKKNKSIKNEHEVSLLFIKASLLFLVISSLGPWLLGIIMSKGLSGHPIYNLCIYFYLHFQYDGWFTFALLGLFFAFLERKEFLHHVSMYKKFFWLMFVSCITGYSLSTLWLDPDKAVYIIGFISASMQLIALIYFLILVIKDSTISIIPPFAKRIFLIAITCFVIKIILQWFSVFIPIFNIRGIIIGYLHLTLIGFISLSIIYIASLFTTIQSGRYLKISLSLIIAGFIMSELILFLQGYLSWKNLGTISSYESVLFISSMLMPIGFLMLLVSQLSKSKFKNTSYK